MSQITDYNVANASGAAVRSDINNIFLAVASANSGTAEPSTMYPFMIWVDTTNNLVKLRNGANDGWLTLPYSMTASNTVDIDGGTVDGITSLSVSGTTSLDGAVTINDSSNDVDFRVESDNATHALFIDGASGNVGIGAVPKTTETGWTNLSVGGQGALINSTAATAGGRTQLSNNVYTDESGNYSYISTDEASLYKQINGTHSWHYAASGTADAHITMSEAMIITSGGAVGINTSAPASPTGYGTAGVLHLKGASGNDCSLVFEGMSGSGGRHEIGCSGGSLQFMRGAATGSMSESLRIDASGNVMINCTANAAYPGGSFEALATGTTYCTNTTASGFECQTFRYYNTQVGSIALSGTTGTNYNTSSDARLKNVLGDAKGLEVINYLNPVNFEWKASEETQDGLIAQEVMEIVPYAVSEDSDGYYQMDYSNLVTPLIKAVQEQQEQIEELKQQINELKEEN